MSAVVGQGARTAWNGAVWKTVQEVVEAVRFQPRRLDLLLAYRNSLPEVAKPLVRWLFDARVIRVQGLPHMVVRRAADVAGRLFGPTASVLIRWVAGAAASAADRFAAAAVDFALAARAHPGLLVPHPHEVAVLAVDMRGFSALTRQLHDTQYLTDLISEYLTELTDVVERHRGIVFHYTGDGLIAVFLPEIAGETPAEMLRRLVESMAPDLHAAFDALYDRWRTGWEAEGREVGDIGLGTGMSFGRATIGYLGPLGKKQIGVLGEPVNLAAFLCAQAPAGGLLVDRASFARVAMAPPAGKTIRLRSKKAHQRIETISLVLGRPRALPIGVTDVLRGLRLH